MAQAETPAHSAGTIPELEGLRGVLACWVVFGHWATSIALSFKPLRQNLWDVQAVDVFVILSGFVITLLLDRAPTGYGRYLARRWFRIAPVFIAVLLAAAVLLPYTDAVLMAAPKGEMLDVRQDILADTHKYFVSDLLLHLGLLHGLVPLAVQPYAAYSFVGQAWSISLEWQFYIVAPLFFMLARQWRRPLNRLVLVALALGLMAVGPWFSPAYIGNKLPLFALGAGSYLLWRRVTTTGLPFTVPKLRLLTAALVGLCLASRQDGLMGPALWLAVLHCLLVVRAGHAGPERLVGQVLRVKPIQFLGRISYSLYLVHFLVLVSGMGLLQQLGITAPKPFAALLLVYLLPLSVLAAWLMHIVVEKPGMRYGKQLTQR